MNFLAHSHLSGDNDELLFGNFIADAVKGKSHNGYAGDIRKGILLHRRIDTFTDTHPVFRESLQRIRSHFGKFSGIVVDIYYDHFLAQGWSHYSDQPLPVYAEHVYSILQSRYELLPPRTKRLLPYLTSQNWLVGYANLNGLNAVFHGMDRRTGLRSGMSNAVPVLVENYEGLKSDFTEFYPLLEKYTEGEIAGLEEYDSFGF